MGRRFRPPSQICLGCGARFFGYRQVCGLCMREQRLDSAAVVDEIRARRQEMVDRLEPSRPVEYNEFPEGF